MGDAYLLDTHVLLCVASFWELINKKRKHVAPVKDPVPWHHKGPFNRILIAQSVVGKMPLVTDDVQIRKYGIEIAEGRINVW